MFIIVVPKMLSPPDLQASRHLFSYFNGLNSSSLNIWNFPCGVALQLCSPKVNALFLYGLQLLYEVSGGGLHFR